MKPRGHIDTAAKFTAAREYLGLSKAELARVLRLGKGGRDAIRRAETNGPSGPQQLAMEALLAGWRPLGQGGKVLLPSDKENDNAEA